MIVPPPWDCDAPRELPRPFVGTFDELFWNVVHTYTGHTHASLLLLQECGVALSESLIAGSSSVYDVLRPVVPPPLENDAVGCIPAEVPMEDLPSVTCCRDVTAITGLRRRCFEYGASVAQLLRLAKRFSEKWGRLRLEERDEIHAALTRERISRIHGDDLRACFADLNFTDKGLKQLTPDITRFTNLTTLVLSNNPQLTSITYLPPNCLVFVACGCSIKEVCPSKTLIFLGLAYNMLETLDFIHHLPELRVLDLTRNAVFSIEGTVEAIQKHPHLEDVTFIGNPIALVDNYTEHMTTGCPRLQRLDHLPTVFNTTATTPSTKNVASGTTATTTNTNTITNSAVAPGAATSNTTVQFKRMTNGTLTIPADEGTTAVTDEVKDTTPSILLSVQLLKMEGLSALTHNPVSIEEPGPLVQHETKGTKGKKKAKTAPVGPTYECSTRMSLHGYWGESDILVVACDDLQLLPDALLGAQQQQHHTSKKKAHAATTIIEDVLQLNHNVSTRVTPSAALSHSLEQPFFLKLEVHDEIRLPSGNTVKLSCPIGSFYADASGLLVNTAPPPRRMTLRESLLISEVALEESEMHIRELRDRAATSIGTLTQFTCPPETPLAFSGTRGSAQRRLKKSTSISGRNAAVEQLYTEMKKCEAKAAELQLLAKIEERRMEELRRAALTITLEFSLGSPPQVAEQLDPLSASSARSKNSRRRPVEKNESVRRQR